MFREYKRLNHFGKMFGIKRKWFETNKKYSERLKQKLLIGNEPEFTRTKKKLLEALKESGFILDNFKIIENYKKGKIFAVIEMF